jgi:hypothetical protein
MRKMKTILRLLKVSAIWTKLTFHNTWGIINVFNIVWLRPMKGGILKEDHPMVTGINPDSKNYIWRENIIFQSTRSNDLKDVPDDLEILDAVANHMREMVAISSHHPDAPSGKPDRMPPAINYIHACVFYNGGYLIFNDFKDAIRHYSDPLFQKEFKNFVNKEGREPVTVFRNKNYDPKEYLEFVCFLRSIFPWFSNTNGNKKRIGWGNPAPYPATNTITGFWKDDLYKFYSEKGLKTLCRKPIEVKYFSKKEYFGPRDFTYPEEKYLARFTDNRVQARGAKGNMFFVDLRKLNKGYRFDPSKKLPNIIDRLIEKMSEKV